MGGDGQGVVVAMVDSGANTAHPDLVANVWTNPGESGRDSQGNDKASNGIDDDGNGFVDDIHGWNFEDGNGDVTDADGHGTQSAGVVAGDGTSGLQTGVAPRAKLMILRACCQSDHEIFESHAWESMEYAIENGAQVISMSLTAKDETHPTYARWRQTDEVLLVAGIAHVNSAGNKGASRIPRNLGAPATDPPAWFNPRQKAGIPSAMISVGATDASDQVRRYSSFGPATWEDIAGYLDFPYRAGALPGLMKPEVCAPSEVPSLNASGAGYTKSFGGTSSSTPHVAGTVALLLALNSGLSVEQITEALEVSAVAVGDKYNNDCGGGRIDALAAAKYVNAMPVGPAPKVSR
jgi:subtilisin family serine protease